MSDGSTGTAPSPLAEAIAALLTEADFAVQAAKKPALSWFDAQHMPALRWKTGETVPPVALSCLLLSQATTNKMLVEGRAETLVELIDKTRSPAFALALLNGWLTQGAPAKEAWCLPLIVVLGDEQIVPVLHRQIDTWVNGARGAMAAKAVAALALSEQEQAFIVIDTVAARVKHRQVKLVAQEALLQIAKRLKLSPEELSDRLVPRLGFNDRGEQVLDYGPRQFTVRLGLDRTLHLSDSAGKRIAALPKPGVHDDAEKAAAAPATLKLLKYQLQQAIKAQTVRLENALVTQRSWQAASWQALFLHHPLLRSFAITLIWAWIPPGKTMFQTLFRPLEDGSLTDARDEQVTLPADGHVRLVHPIELDEQTLAAWKQHISDYDLVQPFLQLARPIHLLSADERNAKKWEKYHGYLMNGGSFKGRYQKTGWQHGSPEDNGVYSNIWKTFPEAGIEALLEISGLPIGFEREMMMALVSLIFLEDASIKHGGRILFARQNDQRIIPLGEVPPLIWSEVASDVEAFAASGQYDENWKQKIY